MSKSVKTRIKREAMLKALKATLKTMEAEIKAYEVAKVKYSKDYKAYEKAVEDWNKKITAYVVKNGEAEKDYRTHWNTDTYTVTLQASIKEVVKAIGEQPKAEDFITPLVSPTALENVRITNNDWSTGIQLVKEAIWNLENSDDEYIYSNTYAHVVKFVA